MSGVDRDIRALPRSPFPVAPGKLSPSSKPYVDNLCKLSAATKRPKRGKDETCQSQLCFDI